MKVDADFSLKRKARGQKNRPLDKNRQWEYSIFAFRKTIECGHPYFFSPWRRDPHQPQHIRRQREFIFVHVCARISMHVSWPHTHMHTHNTHTHTAPSHAHSLACAHTYTHTHLHTYMHKPRLHIHIGMRTHPHTDILTHIHAHTAPSHTQCGTRTHPYTYTLTHIHTVWHAHTHIHVHTYTHTRTDIHLCIQFRAHSYCRPAALTHPPTHTYR